MPGSNQDEYFYGAHAAWIGAAFFMVVAKFFAARVLHDVIDRAVQVHGARGLTDETPLAAMLAMARGARIYDGPDEVHRMVVARRILKSFAAGDGWHFD